MRELQKSLETDGLTLPQPSTPFQDLLLLPNIIQADTQDKLSVQDPVFGRSPVHIEHQATQASRRAHNILLQALDLGIFSPVQICEAPYIVHSLNGSVFKIVTDAQEMDWYVNPRIRVLGRSTRGQMVDPSVVKAPFTIVSGMCLFGPASVYAETSEGQSFFLFGRPPSSKIKRIHVNRTLHPYEMEAVLRLTSFLKHVLQREQLHVCLNIPRFEYWLFGLDLYRQGLIDQEQTLYWFDEVDLRVRKIQNFMVKALPYMDVEFQMPLAPVETLLRTEVARGNPHILAQIIEIISVDPIWKHLLERVHMKADRRSKQDMNRSRDHFGLQDLGRLSYIRAYAQAFERGKEFTIVLEGPEEAPLLERSQTLLADFRTMVLGLYVHPYFLVPANRAIDNKQYLFWYDDSQDDVRSQLVNAIYTYFSQKR